MYGRDICNLQPEIDDLVDEFGAIEVFKAACHSAEKGMPGTTAQESAILFSILTLRDKGAV